MVECKWRILLESQDNNGIEKAMDKALGFPEVPTVIVGKSRQNFQNGLCALLTRNDIGPMACYQPQHNENSCPDIEDLRG